MGLRRVGSLRVSGKELIFLAVLMPVSHIILLTGFVRMHAGMPLFRTVVFSGVKGLLVSSFDWRLLQIQTKRTQPLVDCRSLSWSRIGIAPRDAVAASLVAARSIYRWQGFCSSASAESCSQASQKTLAFGLPLIKTIFEGSEFPSCLGKKG